MRYVFSCVLSSNRRPPGLWIYYVRCDRRFGRPHQIFELNKSLAAVEDHAGSLRNPRRRLRLRRTV